MYSRSFFIRMLENEFIFVTRSEPSAQKVHEKGHPLLVWIIGASFPSKNSSKIPVEYGEGISSNCFILVPIVGICCNSKRLLFMHPGIDKFRIFFRNSERSLTSSAFSIIFENPTSPSNGT